MTMVNYQKMSLEKKDTIISIFDYSRLNLKFQEMIYRNRTILISYFLWHILRVIKIILKDRLSFYRFQKKPTHSRGYHFIPSNLLNLEKSTVDGKERLSRLSETAFQELCADVYDEVNRGFFIRVDQTLKVDRRELETVWRASNGSRRSTATTSHIAHLALHPNFTQMRNQGKGLIIARHTQMKSNFKNSSLLYSVSFKLSELWFLFVYVTDLFVTSGMISFESRYVTYRL